MNKYLRICCLLAVINCAAGQFGNFGGGGFGNFQNNAQTGRGGFGQASNGAALNAAQQDAINSQALLNAASRDKESLNAANSIGDRVNAAERQAAQTRLSANDAAQAEQFGDFAETSNLNAANSVNEARKTGIQIVDESVFNNKAAFNLNEAAKFNAGDRAQAAASVDFADFANAESLFGKDFFANNALKADVADESLLNAAARDSRISDNFLNAQDFNNDAFNFQDQFAGQEFGGFNQGSGFGSNFFGRRRRR